MQSNIGYNGRIFIVEIDEFELLTLGQLIHIGKIAYKDTEMIDKVLTSLKVQTDIIRDNPKAHDVFPRVIDAPIDAEKTDQVCFIPYKRK